jgi:hypothetical protein
MRWVRHIACMGQMRNITLSGRDGRIRMWIMFVWLRIGTAFGLL